MENLSIANNRKTQELIGYWTPEGSSVGIVVTAYAVDDLQKKFAEAKQEWDAKELKAAKKTLRNHSIM